MFIDSDILLTWGGVAKKYKKGEYIFHEGDHPVFYYQILDGNVKMFNTNSDGKEFTQAEFESGESFGEPPLFIDEAYPSTAIVTKDSVLLKLSKEKFFEILEEYPDYQKKIISQEQAKMTWSQIKEDNRLNPVPMIPETNTKEYFDESGKLTRSYSLEKGGQLQTGELE